MKIVLKPLPKSRLIPFGLTDAASETYAAIHKTMNTELIISNEEMNGTIKKNKSLEESGLLIKGVTEKGRFHHLTNFEIQKHQQNEPTFNGVSSIKNLPKIKDRTSVTYSEDFGYTITCKTSDLTEAVTYTATVTVTPY